MNSGLGLLHVHLLHLLHLACVHGSLRELLLHLCNLILIELLVALVHLLIEELPPGCIAYTGFGGVAILEGLSLVHHVVANLVLLLVGACHHVHLSIVKFPITQQL